MRKDFLDQSENRLGNRDLSTNRIATIAFLSVSLLVGCGGSGTSLKLLPVKGTVTKSGAGIKGVTVALHADDSKSLAPALLGVTDDQGAFEIQTVSGEKGAVEGTYTVVLTPPSAEFDYSKPGKRGPQQESDLIPKNFQSRETSIEKCEVKSSGAQLDIKIP